MRNKACKTPCEDLMGTEMPLEADWICAVSCSPDSWSLFLQGCFSQSNTFFHKPVPAGADGSACKRVWGLDPHMCPGLLPSLLLVKNCTSKAISSETDVLREQTFPGTTWFWQSLILKEIETKYLNNATMFFLTFSKCHILIFRFQMSFP